MLHRFFSSPDIIEFREDVLTELVVGSRNSTVRILRAFAVRTRFVFHSSREIIERYAICNRLSTELGPKRLHKEQLFC